MNEHVLSTLHELTTEQIYSYASDLAKVVKNGGVIIGMPEEAIFSYYLGSPELFYEAGSVETIIDGWFTQSFICREKLLCHKKLRRIVTA